MDFKNKNVVITGGSTGIGFATTQAFIQSGANVWITSRNAENLQLAAQKINSQKLKTVVSDTSSLLGIEALEKQIVESGNKLDVLFLNAGIATFSTIEQTTEADFDAQFNTNVKGAFFTLQKMIPHLADSASVVFTSSTVATVSMINGSVYSATKGALNKIAKIAANELADRKIRVNIVSPGPTETPGINGAITPEVKEFFETIIPVKRLANPDEIAKAVLFLASDNASFITGTELLVDGGIINYMLK